jgi:hypothetical protein
MRDVRITMIATVIVMVALAGCEATNGPPQTSAPVTVYLHGRMDVGIGASTH